MKHSNVRRVAIIVGLVVTLGLIALYAASTLKERKETAFEIAEITRGDLENLVTCTGTLTAVGTVEIGTQVSGTIAEIMADFNDRVSNGQILAVLDTTLLEAAVMEAEAGLMSAQAQYDQAEADYDRDLQLYNLGHISQNEFASSEVEVQVREAGVMSALASLERAEANLKYAVVRSPIDGTVIQRNVEPGQTVAASLSAPTLFIVAEDLSEMEIHADVDENDIGEVEEGQTTRFTVQAYPGETFEGTVSQVRVQPETIQNVVNYTAVIDVQNTQGLLLPGMTATVDFIVEQRNDVLLVPNAALRIVPTEEMVAEVRESRQQAGDGSGEAGGAGQPRPDGEKPDDVKPMWYLDQEGQIGVRVVHTGATDGRNTEIVAGQNLCEGMQIISGLAQSVEESNAKDQQTPGRGPGFRMF